MSLGNKKLRILFFGLLCLLATVFIIKQAQGYSPISNFYNAYYNIVNGFDINNSHYKVKLPFFAWRIREKNDTNIILSGIKTKKGFLMATFDNNFSSKSLNFSSKSLDDINKMCEGEQKINSIIMDGYNGYDLFCKNNNLDELKPYRIIFVPQKLFIFMYEYQIQYDNEYEKLISRVKLK